MKLLLDASVWKTIIKYHLGKLPLPAPPSERLAPHDGGQSPNLHEG